MGQLGQPWWVYGAVALGCTAVFLAMKIIESKFMRKEDDLFFPSIITGGIGLIAAVRAAEALGLFG